VDLQILLSAKKVGDRLKKDNTINGKMAMEQHTTNNKIEKINKIYDYAHKLIEEENKDKEEVTKVLMEMGVDEHKASTIYSNVIFQVNLAKERNADYQDNKSVKGWLLFFLITIGIGFSISAIIG